MSTPTYTLINQVTLAASSTQIVFSSLPQNYRDLILVTSGTITGSQGNNFLYFNGDTTQGNYSAVRMIGDGSSAGSATLSNGATVSDMTSAQNSVIIQVLDYSAIDKHKTRLSRSDQPSSTVIAYASRWVNTAAVTSLTFNAGNSGSFGANTTFSLYGIVG